MIRIVDYPSQYGLVVNFPTVPDLPNIYNQNRIIDIINNPIISYSDTIQA